MRISLTILILCIVIGSSAQSLHAIEARLRLLERKDSIQYDTTGLHLLPKSTYLCDGHFEQFGDSTRNTLDYYHVTDLNGDGLKDLIYSGPCLPYDVTGIFLNEGSRLKRVYEYGGKIVSIDKQRDVVRVNILYDAIGCHNYSELIQVTIHKNSLVEKHHILFAKWSDIVIDKVERANVTGIVRTKREVDDQERKDNCSGQIFKGNHLTQIKTLTNVIQLSTNGPWKLVLCSDERNKEISWLGWIKTM